MAAFQNHPHSPAVDNIAYYDDRFTSYSLHHHNPTAPVIMGDQYVEIFGYVQEGYALMYSQYWVPMYYLQYQPQPYAGSSINHNVINHPASNNYHQFMPCDDSWILNAQEEEEEEEEEEEDETGLSEEELRVWNLLDGELVVYDSTDDDDGLSEETITKHLKTRDQHPDNAQICVVCQDCLFQEDENIATLDCGHDFHAGCIKSWLMLKNCCPLCKATGIRL